MNLADDVGEQANSSDSDESIDKKDKVQGKNGKQYEEVAMSSLDVSLSAYASSTARDSAAVLNHPTNAALPEDNEIVEATNEDEE